jgi:hypothetical protein
MKFCFVFALIKIAGAGNRGGSIPNSGTSGNPTYGGMYGNNARPQQTPTREPEPSNDPPQDRSIANSTDSEQDKTPTKYFFHLST